MERRNNVRAHAWAASCCSQPPARFSSAAKPRRARHWLRSTLNCWAHAHCWRKESSRGAASHLARPARHARASPDCAQSSARRRLAALRGNQRRITSARRTPSRACCSATCATSSSRLARSRVQPDLAQSIRALAVEHTGLAIHLDLPDTLSVDDRSRAETLIRCVQEIITNTTRHAQARNLWIRLEARARRHRPARA